jgi:hypothetical protein
MTKDTVRMADDDDALRRRRRQLEIARLDVEEEELRIKKARLEKEDQELKDGKRESSKSMLELNVGGQVFATSRETLLQHGSPYFERILEAGDTGSVVVKGTQLDSNGRLFIDRSPDLFRRILEYMRGSLHFEDLTETEKRVLRDEASYYQLDGLTFRLKY